MFELHVHERIMTQKGWMICSISHGRINVMVQTKISWFGLVLPLNKHTAQLSPQLNPPNDLLTTKAGSSFPRSFTLATSGSKKQIPGRFLFEILSLPLTHLLNSCFRSEWWPQLAVHLQKRNVKPFSTLLRFGILFFFMMMI